MLIQSIPVQKRVHEGFDFDIATLYIDCIVKYDWKLLLMDGLLSTSSLSSVHIL